MTHVPTPSLGVALPTYRRPECVARRLAEVQARGGRIACIHVSDNSPEDDPVAAAAARPEGPVLYGRNRGNIGGGANFLRAIEGCPTDYVWLRGDDDPITDGQFAALQAHLTPVPRLIILAPSETEVFHGRGIREFADHFRRVRAMGWLSMIVLPGDVARRALAWGYWGVHTGWANVCLVLGLFRVQPDLEFTVVPFRMEEGDFREVGREDGARWAFFTTCIQQFPRTAGVIEDPAIRKLYLRRWRATQTFPLVKTLARQLAGIGSNERITPATFGPLFALDSPASSALGIVFIAMTLVPRPVWQLILAAWAGRQSAEALDKLGLAWLHGGSFASRLSRLRARRRGERVGTFL